MADDTVMETLTDGRKVRAETLAVAPAVLGLTLAEPWKRLGAMVLDLVVIGLLSLLSGPILAIATGSMLVVLLGNKEPAPVMLNLARWVCRVVGVVFIGVAILVLGHWSFVRSEQLNLEMLTGQAESPAMKKTVMIDPQASDGQLLATANVLRVQVDDLKAEVATERAASGSLLGRTRTFTGTLGVTFGWSGVYFTLLAGLLNGRTLGKLIFGIRAVKINGAPFSFFDGFVRQGGYIAGVAMGMIGFVKLLWEPNRQAVQDRIAATVVVKVLAFCLDARN